MYCLLSEGLSIDRTKIDLFEAYAILWPFESELRCVYWPRIVVGAAAQIASVGLSDQNTAKRAKANYHM